MDMDKAPTALSPQEVINKVVRRVWIDVVLVLLQVGGWSVP
jgi:hypothetical protein